MNNRRQKVKNMELKEYLNILLKRIWLIVVFPIIASILSMYVSFFVLAPVYESNTTLYIITKSSGNEFSIAYNDLLTSQQLVKDYKEIVKSRRVTSRVIDELNITNLSASKLADKISVNSKNDTRLIEIKVEDNNPELASNIANKVAEVFISEITKFMNLENINIVDTAQPSIDPIKPRPLMNTAVAFIVGLLLAVGLAFAIEYLDDTIKSAEDVEKYLGVTVLGSVPEFSEK
jgi:capsular polysaccharide biosynthesis protein